METTTIDYVETTCRRCSGQGFLSAFQHHKGGYCFACGGSGKGSPRAIKREMTYAEMVTVLETKGINIVRLENPSDPNDWIQALFTPPEVVEGTRLLLQSL